MSSLVDTTVYPQTTVPISHDAFALHQRTIARFDSKALSEFICEVVISDHFSDTPRPSDTNGLAFMTKDLKASGTDQVIIDLISVLTTIFGIATVKYATLEKLDDHVLFTSKLSIRRMKEFIWSDDIAYTNIELRRLYVHACSIRGGSDTKAYDAAMDACHATARKLTDICVSTIESVLAKTEALVPVDTSHRSPSLTAPLLA